MSNRFEKWEQKIKTCKGSRQSFAIQLDWSNPDDVELIKIIALLKDNDKFSDAMRKALRIIPAMMFSGSLDELFEEFPWAKLEALEYLSELFSSEAKPAKTPPSDDTPPEPEEQTDTDTRRAQVEALREQVEAQKRWLEAEQERLEAEREWQERRLAEERERIEVERNQSQSTIQKQLQRLEELLLQQGNVPVQSTQQTVAPEKPSGGVGLKGNSPSGNGLKGGGLGSTIAAPPPIFDDDDMPELNFTSNTTKTGKLANQNLINGLLGLQSQ